MKTQLNWDSVDHESAPPHLGASFPFSIYSFGKVRGSVISGWFAVVNDDESLFAGYVDGQSMSLA